MQARRTLYDFLVEIVTSCQEPIQKTDLYHKIKTQFSIFERWLNTTIRFKLVAETGNNKYQTTQKGKRFLIAWEHIQEFLTEEP